MPLKPQIDRLEELVRALGGQPGPPGSGGGPLPGNLDELARITKVLSGELSRLPKGSGAKLLPIIMQMILGSKGGPR